MVEMNTIPWSPVLRYATPLPMNRTPVSTIAFQHKSVFVRIAVRHTPLDQQDPHFDRRSVSSVLRYATPLLINRTPVSTVGGPFPHLCGTPGLVSIAYSVQALLMNTTTHSVLTQPVGSHVFRCLSMNTTHSVASP